MATYLISIPVVITRTVAVVGPDVKAAAEAIITHGAETTNLMPHVDAVVGFYRNKEGGIQYGWQEVEGEDAKATNEKPPEGTVIQ